MWSERQLIYLAGIMDGEGCFYISKEFRHRMYVVNTDERIIRWLKTNFGGFVYSRISKKNPHWKRKYEWVITKPEVRDICTAIIPYLVGKREQAELMVKFRDSFTLKCGNGQKIPEDIFAFRTQCFEELKKLNHRIPLPL
jgi:hypothetical protein